MMDEPDDYEVFLETWEPSELLIHTSLTQNLEDPFSRERLLDDMTGQADVMRTTYQRGTKLMGADEARVRAYAYVRRGVKMPQEDAHRIELSELSSYSLGIGAVEQFAQQHTDATEHTGIQSIFSAPLPAVQNRIVAFAPFIAGMDLRQLELVVAPRVGETPFVDQGGYGGIREYGFL